MEIKERAVLVGCQLPHVDDFRFDNSMNELASLTDTANGEVIVTLAQKRERIEPSTYIGKGKIQELTALVKELEIDIVIFNSELTPSQLRNLSNQLGVKIIDRTQLILDIFAQRARSREGKLQVELAQLQYLLPRLSGQGMMLSRLGGGIGTRGPGETQLETDRRHIRRRIHDIKDQLDVVVQHRQRYRDRRKKNQNFQVALIGYTNAGKSTLFNHLSVEDAYEEDKLFATLDPLTRKMVLPSGYTILLSDTVGFIEDLPTQLIAAFRSTLEEVTEADLLLHVVDSSNPDYDQHEKTVQSILKELDAEHIPVLTIYNKADIMDPAFIPTAYGDVLIISAFREDDILKVKDKVEEKMLNKMERYDVALPASGGKILARLKRETVLRELRFEESSGTYRCKGFIFPDHPLKGMLQNGLPGDEKPNVE